MQSGHSEFGQAAYPPQYVYPPPMPSVQSNPGHDMSKQLAAGQPGMFQNSAGMASAVQQHHQSQMGGPVPSQQQASLVQQGQQLSRGPISTLQMNNYYQRPNVPRSMSGMGRSPLTPVVNQTGQQPNTQFSHVQVVQSTPFHPGLHSSIQPMMLNQYQQVYPQRQFPQYPTLPPVFLNNWNSYNNTPQPNTNGYFQHGISTFNTMAPQMQHQQQQPVAPQQTQQRSKRLAIIDPITGKSIFDASNDENNSSPPLEKETESDSNICIQFASQVAATLVNNKCEPSSKSSVDDTRVMDSQNAILCLNEIDQGRVEESAVGTRIIDDTLSLGELADTESSSDMEYVEGRNNKECIENRNVQCNEEAFPALYKPPLNPETVLWNQTCNQECVPAFDEAKCPPQNVDSLPQELKESNLCDVLEELAIKESDELKLDVQKHETGSVLEESLGYSKTQIQNVQLGKEADNSKPVCDSSQPSSVSNVVKEETRIPESSAEVAEVITPVGASSKLPDKSIESKKNKAKKKKDYNKKGESKEGGEMDAFLDNKVEETSTTPTIMSSVPPFPPPVVDRLPSPVPIVDSDILSSIPLPGETFENFQQNDISPSEPTSETSSVSPSADSEDKENASEDTPNKIVLKYSYKEDQWSPLNPEGKKQYDRDFLLQLQSQPMSLCKPTNLPNLDVIKDKAHIQRLTEISRATQQAPVSQIRPYNDPFMPNYARGGAARLPHPPINRRSQTGRGEKARKVISFTSSLTQSVKLHESENAWKPMYKVEQAADLNVEDWDKEKLKRSVQGVLNKLTPQKFETLLTQLKNLSIDTEEKLKLVIDLIFEKAIDEPNFSVPYANLCKHLAQIKVPLAGQTGQHVNFRKLLLTKCQKEFEQDRCDEIEREEKLKAIESAEAEAKKTLKLEFDEEEKKIRYRQLGNIRFIGELFKLNMLIEPIMHECIKKLLSQEDEESLECLCRLLKTIGKELDEGKPTKNSRENLMDTYFNQMQNIVDKRMTSSRVRFMLQDVIDLKKNNWVPRRDENNPKTIDQIHKEAEREAREQQQVYQNMSSYPKRLPDDRDRRKSTARNMGLSEDGWTPSSSKSNKGSYSTVDPLKLKLTKPDDVDGIRLGPGGRGLSSWGRGSSGGTKAPDSDVKTALTNRYSALAEQVPTQSYEGRRGSQRSAASSRESSRGRNNQLPPAIRKTPSTSKERESLLETVKGLARGHENKPQDVKKKEVHLNGKSTDSEELILRGPEYSEEEMEKKTKPLVDEFLHNNDFDEAVKCVTELASPNTVHMFINYAINQVLERSSQARHLLGQLLCSIAKKKIITLDQYKKGFRDVLEMLDEFAVDIPLIWEYIGEILAPLVEDNEFPLSFLKDVLQPCMPSESAGLLVSAILHSAGKRKGTIKLGEVWRDSGLQWTDFLGSDSNVNEFVQTHKLEFTLCPTKIKPKTQMSLEEIQTHLSSLLKKSDENEEIFDWIDANVSENSKPDFIRALVTAVHEDVITVFDTSYKLDTTKLKKRTTLLTRYIEKDENLELQALYAIQALMNQLGHPSGLLHQLFDILYDDDVISEEAFKQWEHSDDPNEEEGKGVALHSSISFFTWLRESESGDDDGNE